MSKICLNHEIENNKQHIDVCLSIKNNPFITLEESYISNIWFHRDFDRLFILTSRGFVLTKGNKRKLLTKPDLH